jgi:hypothetical protein
MAYDPAEPADQLDEGEILAESLCRTSACRAIGRQPQRQAAAGMVPVAWGRIARDGIDGILEQNGKAACRQPLGDRAAERRGEPCLFDGCADHRRRSDVGARGKGRMRPRHPVRRGHGVGVGRQQQAISARRSRRARPPRSPWQHDGPTPHEPRPRGNPAA